MEKRKRNIMNTYTLQLGDTTMEFPTIELAKSKMQELLYDAGEYYIWSDNDGGFIYFEERVDSPDDRDIALGRITKQKK